AQQEQRGLRASFFMHHIYEQQPLCARLLLRNPAPSSITKLVIMSRLLMWVALIGEVIWMIKSLRNQRKPKSGAEPPEIEA
ncbi:hypothetical protein RA265_29335, partial [Pseudomonas syringae pv. tagetis]